jgi:hypothetical protein
MFLRQVDTLNDNLVLVMQHAKHLARCAFVVAGYYLYHVIFFNVHRHLLYPV